MKERIPVHNAGGLGSVADVEHDVCRGFVYDGVLGADALLLKLLGLAKLERGPHSEVFGLTHGGGGLRFGRDGGPVDAVGVDAFAFDDLRDGFVVECVRVVRGVRDGLFAGLQHVLVAQAEFVADTLQADGGVAVTDFADGFHRGPFLPGGPGRGYLYRRTPARLITFIIITQKRY